MLIIEPFQGNLLRPGEVGERCFAYLSDGLFEVCDRDGKSLGQYGILEDCKIVDTFLPIHNNWEKFEKYCEKIFNNVVLRGLIEYSLDRGETWTLINESALFYSGTLYRIKGDRHWKTRLEFINSDFNLVVDWKSSIDFLGDSKSLGGKVGVDSLSFVEAYEYRIRPLQTGENSYNKTSVSNDLTTKVEKMSDKKYVVDESKPEITNTLDLFAALARGEVVKMNKYPEPVVIIDGEICGIDEEGKAYTQDFSLSRIENRGAKILKEANWKDELSPTKRRLCWTWPSAEANHKNRVATIIGYNGMYFQDEIGNSWECAEPLTNDEIKEFLR